MRDCELAVEIIKRAVDDWHLLIRAKAWNYKVMRAQHSGIERIPSYRCNFDELRRFFKSDWCEDILAGIAFPATKESILAALEEELAKAMEKAAARERRKHEQRTM